MTAYVRKHFRTLKSLQIFCREIVIKTREVITGKTDYEKVSGYDVVYHSGFVIKRAVQRQSVDLCFLVADYPYRVGERIDDLNVSSDFMLK